MNAAKKEKETRYVKNESIINKVKQLINNKETYKFVNEKKEKKIVNKKLGMNGKKAES